jgi:hypothetical protein
MEKQIEIVDLAVNSDSPDDVKEKKLWDNHIDSMSDKEKSEAKDQRYFWITRYKGDPSVTYETK